MVSYRSATEKDIEGIASLHARSWQEHYRGALSDDFLDEHALSDRKLVWSERLQNSDPGQKVIVALSDGIIEGFVCVFLEHSQSYGTLLDNLHVASKLKGHGIGTQLMLMAAEAISERLPDSGMYLWVLDQNHDAIRFYENLGGTKIETVKEMDIGDRPVVKSRYYWKTVASLIKRPPKK